MDTEQLKKGTINLLDNSYKFGIAGYIKVGMQVFPIPYHKILILIVNISVYRTFIYKWLLNHMPSEAGHHVLGLCQIILWNTNL